MWTPSVNVIEVVTEVLHFLQCSMSLQWGSIVLPCRVKVAEESLTKSAVNGTLATAVQGTSE